MNKAVFDELEPDAKFTLDWYADWHNLKIEYGTVLCKCADRQAYDLRHPRYPVYDIWPTSPVSIIPPRVTCGICMGVGWLISCCDVPLWKRKHIRTLIDCYGCHCLRDTFLPGVAASDGVFASSLRFDDGRNRMALRYQPEYRYPGEWLLPRELETLTDRVIMLDQGPLPEAAPPVSPDEARRSIALDDSSFGRGRPKRVPKYRGRLHRSIVLDVHF